jgi:hypothetical protein
MVVTLALLEVLGIPARPVPLRHHTVLEAQYEGGWHLVDPLFFGGQQPERDGRVLAVAELQADPYLADAWPQRCFAYDPELVTSADGFWVLGYVFGPWGSEPYYSYYLGAPKDHPPTLPHALPATRAGADSVDLHWSPAVKSGGGPVEYDLRVFDRRACAEPVYQTLTSATTLRFQVPEEQRMYYVEVRAVDDHRQLNPATWYPAARSNFALVPPEQYGWYGVL